MTTTYDNNNRGVLFSERDRKTKDTDPDYAGKLNVDGVEHWLHAWVKTSKKTGQKFLSLSVRAKATPPSGGFAKRDVEDEIIF
jgi:hypothetical protein